MYSLYNHYNTYIKMRISIININISITIFSIPTQILNLKLLDISHSLDNIIKPRLSSGYDNNNILSLYSDKLTIIVILIFSN